MKQCYEKLEDCAGHKILAKTKHENKIKWKKMQEKIRENEQSINNEDMEQTNIKDDVKQDNINHVKFDDKDKLLPGIVK